MRVWTTIAAGTMAGCIAATLAWPAAATPAAQAAATTVTTEAWWQMNEPSGATVMTDSSGNGLNGVIDQDGLDTGYVVNGATGYHWARRSPTAPPPAPERVILVPDNSRLDPGTGTFTVEIRYRTSERFGNIIQKGQAHSVGGQWKIQNPKGIPSCLFKDGSGNRVSTAAKTPLNDNTWHVLTCVRTQSSVTMYVDGVFRNRKNGYSGVIDNKKPVAIGGKSECDQVTVTCDYYTGEIDYVKLTRG